jgi:hypothetical protein
MQRKIPLLLSAGRVVREVNEKKQDKDGSYDFCSCCGTKRTGHLLVEDTRNALKGNYIAATFHKEWHGFPQSETFQGILNGQRRFFVIKDKETEDGITMVLSWAGLSDELRIFGEEVVDKAAINAKIEALKASDGTASRAGGCNCPACITMRKKDAEKEILRLKELFKPVEREYEEPFLNRNGQLMQKEVVA